MLCRRPCCRPCTAAVFALCCWSVAALQAFHAPVNLDEDHVGVLLAEPAELWVHGSTAVAPLGREGHADQAVPRACLQRVSERHAGASAEACEQRGQQTPTRWFRNSLRLSAVCRLAAVSFFHHFSPTGAPGPAKASPKVCLQTTGSFQLHVLCSASPASQLQLSALRFEVRATARESGRGSPPSATPGQPGIALPAAEAVAGSRRPAGRRAGGRSRHTGPLKTCHQRHGQTARRKRQERKAGRSAAC